MTDRVVRVCLTGVESSGKSTLARELATAFGTVVVPELVRAHNSVRLARGEVLWTEAEIVELVRRQQALADDLSPRARNGVLILDTDALHVSVWHESAHGGISQRVLDMAREHPADLYLLAGDEIPFIPDDIRDQAFGAYCPLMHLRFVQALQQCGRPWALLRGDVPTRVERAIAFLGSHGVEEPTQYAALTQR